MDRLGWVPLLAAAGCCALVVAVPRRRVALLRLAAALAGLAFARLAWAFVTADYRLVEVADYSRRAVAWPLRLAGAWGGMDGSLLLWSTLLVVVAAGAARGASGPTRVALALVAGSFAALSATAASPFDRLASPPLDGGGLTPILEYPAMVVHPPLLYLGLVLTVGPWADAVAFAAGGRAVEGDEAWHERTRRWMLASWTVLTAGLALGALWAYVEVGWGGYWGWDPVENAALLPWFALLAALHARRAGAVAPRTEVALTGLPFVMVVLAAALTRSGWTSSVHAFAEGRVVGWWLLGLTLAVALALVAAAVRRPGVPTGGRPHPDWRVAGMAVLALGTGAVVALGTIWPFAADLARARPRATSGVFYAAWTGPAAVVACGLLATVALSGRAGEPPWRGERRRAERRAWALAGGAGLAVMGIALAAGWALAPSAALAAVGAVGLVAVAVAAIRRRWAPGPTLAHLGLVVLVLGVAGSTATRASTVTLPPGGAFPLAGYRLSNAGVVVDAGPAGSSGRVTAHIVVEGGGLGGGAGGARTVLRPQLVGYPTRGRLLAETSARRGLLDDVQVALRSADDTGHATIEVRVRPLAGAVWLGAALLVAGGLWAALASRRSRVGVARQRTIPPRRQAPSNSASTGSPAITGR